MRMLSSATSYAESMDQLPTARIIMSFYGSHKNFQSTKGDTLTRLFLRVGRLVLLTQNPLPLQVSIITFRRMLLAVLICQEFYKSAIYVHSSYLAKIHLLALTKLTMMRYKKYSLQELLNIANTIVQKKSLLMCQFPQRFTIDTFPDATHLAMALIRANWSFTAMSQIISNSKE